MSQYLLPTGRKPAAMHLFFACAAAFICIFPAPAAENDGVLLEENFDAGALGWNPIFDKGLWTVDDGVYRCAAAYSLSGQLSPVKSLADALVETEVRVIDPERRRNFGVFVRMQDNLSGAAVRYYDNGKRLELLKYDSGKASVKQGSSEVAFSPGKWHRLKVAAVSGKILAKLYPSGGDEPEWQFVADYPADMQGRIGIFGEDGSQVEFRNFRVSAGPSLAALQDELAKERARTEEEIKKNLALFVRISPLVLRGDEGPQRVVYLRPESRGRLQRLAGKLRIDYDGRQTVREVSVA